MRYDVVIIGSGPAGLTAGIYAARGGMAVAIVGGLYTGGQAALTENIENFSGFSAIDGLSLTSNMHEQAERFGVEFIDGIVTDLQLAEKVKSVTIDGDAVIFASYIILAMGTETKKLGLPKEEELLGRGVSYCATCDGGFFRKKTVAVNGGGDTAVTDALYLANLCQKVYLIHRRQGFRAAKILVDRLKESAVELILDSTITALVGEPLSAIKVKNIITQEEKEIAINGLFVAVGTVPNTGLVKDKIILNEKGYIITDSNMKTSISGVYAAGDIRVTPLRQIITACADGAIAANSIIEDKLATISI